MKKRNLILFCLSLVIALVFWRLYVFLNSGEISILRNITGLNFHHYHYGIGLVFIAVLIFVFSGVERFGVILAGLGFGTYFDGFVSRLLSNPVRSVEIARYNQGFGLTISLFVVLMMFCVFVYLFSGR